MRLSPAPSLDNHNQGLTKYAFPELSLLLWSLQMADFCRTLPFTHQEGTHWMHNPPEPVPVMPWNPPRHTSLTSRHTKRPDGSSVPDPAPFRGLPMGLAWYLVLELDRKASTCGYGGPQHGDPQNGMAVCPSDYKSAAKGQPYRTPMQGHAAC
jgi:hypothetical protein